MLSFLDIVLLLAVAGILALAVPAAEADRRNARPAAGNRRKRDNIQRKDRRRSFLFYPEGRTPLLWENNNTGIMAAIKEE